MLKIEVRLHGQVIQTLELSDPATTYWVGRSENCQISLKAANGISRQHLKIQLKEGLWNAEVVSPFGNVQIGSQSLRQLTLQEGTSFSLPPYEFAVGNQYTMSSQEELPLASGDSKQSGLALSPSSSHHSDHTVTMALSRAQQIVLSYRNSETKEEKIHLLTKNSYQIGRDSGCDIVIEDSKVSRKQFKIIYDASQYFVIDNQGVNKTYLNKTKITTGEPILLKSGDKISILNHHFNFEVRDPDYQNKLEKVQHLTLVDPNKIVAHNLSSLALDPLMNSSNPAIADLSTAMNSPPQTQVKALNFWGLKISLTKENKIRLALGAILMLALIISTSNNHDGSNPVDVENRPANPLSKLTPEEQKQVKVQYELAKDLYTKGNYQLAKEELSKIHAKIPSYLDSTELARFIEVGIQSTKEREHQERLKREAAEAEERIQNIVAYCRQQNKPEDGTQELDDCLAPAIQLNPEHELILKVRAEAQRFEEEKKAKEAELAFKNAQINELRKQFKAAQELGQKNPLKGIKAFEDVLKLQMPDPDKLLVKAKREIKKLEMQIQTNVNSAIASVKTLVDSGKHKEAIIALEKALAVSPEDNSLSEEIERITLDLRKKMQTLYQEAILEENIGNIDTAKDRWQKIIAQDIPNGEYYAKARLKLKKYGGP